MATVKHVALRTPPCGTPAVVVTGEGVSYFHLYRSFIKVVMDKFEHSTVDPHLREVIYDGSPAYCVERFLKVKENSCGCFLNPLRMSVVRAAIGSVVFLSCRNPYCCEDSF